MTESSETIEGKVCMFTENEDFFFMIKKNEVNHRIGGGNVVFIIR